MKTYEILFSILILLISGSAQAWTGRVVDVFDGDTIEVFHNKEQVKIRLYGVDTPEKSQAFGQKAKQLANSLVAGMTVNVEPVTTDKHGLTVGLVSFNGKLLGTELVKAGMAWVHREQCDRQPLCNNLVKQESNAKSNSFGLWTDSDPIPPWDWRRGKKKRINRSKPIDRDAILYIADTTSMVFHQSSDRYSNCKSCAVEFIHRDDAIAAGYRPCGICKP